MLNQVKVVASLLSTFGAALPVIEVIGDRFEIPVRQWRNFVALQDRFQLPMDYDVRVSPYG